MPRDFICPQCRGHLVLDDPIPLRFTCALCGAELAWSNQPPVPAIPLERQVQYDGRLSLGAIIVLAIALCLGMAYILYGKFHFNSVGMLVVVGAITTLIVSVWIGAGRPAQVTASVPPRGAPLEPNRLDSSTLAGTRDPVLSYRTPSPRPENTAVNFSIFIGQAIGGVVFGIIGMIGCGASLGPSGVFAIPVIGFILLFVRNARGFGMGLILAVPVAFMVILAICSGFKI